MLPKFKSQGNWRELTYAKIDGHFVMTTFAIFLFQMNWASILLVLFSLLGSLIEKTSANGVCESECFTSWQLCQSQCTVTTCDACTNGHETCMQSCSRKRFFLKRWQMASRSSKGGKQPSLSPSKKEDGIELNTAFWQKELNTVIQLLKYGCLCKRGVTLNGKYEAKYRE